LNPKKPKPKAPQIPLTLQKCKVWGWEGIKIGERQKAKESKRVSYGREIKKKE